MSWAIVKTAINSTVGTENYRPLDKIFSDGDILVASDSPYLTITNDKDVQVTKTIRIKPIVDASVRLRPTDKPLAPAELATVSLQDANGKGLGSNTSAKVILLKKDEIYTITAKMEKKSRRYIYATPTKNTVVETESAV